MKILWPILSSMMIFFTALVSFADVVMYKETILGNILTRLEIDDNGKADRRVFERKDSADGWKENFKKKQSYPAVSIDIMKFFSQVDWLSTEHIEKLKKVGRYQIDIKANTAGCDSSPSTIKLRKNESEFEEMVATTSTCGQYILIKTSLEESRLILDTFDLVENIQMYREAKGQ